MNKKNGILLFLFCLAAIALYYDYQTIIFKPTQSIHQWRQTDGASLALNYYHEGMEFFKPRTHNLTSDNGTSSYNATGDTPFLYYSVAILYKIFGYHEFLYRLLNTLIYLIGIIFLYRGLYVLLKDVTWASVISLLAFTSPVLVYYGSNYIPDSTALAVSFIALYHFFKYLDRPDNRNLRFMMFFYFLAGSLKITALISYFSIGMLFLLEWTGIFTRQGKKHFPAPGIFISGTIISIGLILAWTFYASWFNRVHESTYFSTTIFPIWNLDHDAIKTILHAIRKNWLPEYFHFSIYILAGMSLLYFIIFNAQIKPAFRIIIPAILAAGIAFFLLQFSLLKDHDYYMINIFIIPILLIAAAAEGLSRQKPRIFHSPYLKALMIILVLYNVYYSNGKLNERYYSEKNLRMLANNDFYDITPALRNLGLDRNTRVISLPGGNHINLYLADQKGWTEFTDSKFNRDKPYKYNSDRDGILRSINNGAEYLILGNVGQLFLKPYLNEFATHLSGIHRNVLIFKLKSDEKNFDIENRVTECQIACGAEFFNEDSRYFLSDDSLFLLEYPLTRTDEFSFSGNYSSRLDKTQKYGMTIVLDSLINGESFEVSVRVKGTGNKGSIEITGRDSREFYLSENRRIRTSDPDWDSLYVQFFIPEQMDGSSLKIYLYNPDEEPVYFDNFLITRYKSILDNILSIEK